MEARETLAPMFPWATAFFAVVGLCVGSFLNVCVWRLPRDESVISPGSHCPRCNEPIRAWQNVPVFSWLVLRGRCSHCREPIALRYPLIELACGVLFTVLWLKVWFGRLPFELLPGYLVLGSALLAAALIDAEHLLIPDEITGGGILAALGFALFFPASHLPGGGPTEPLLAGPVMEWLADACPSVWGRPAFASLTDAVLGGLSMGGALWGFLEVGRLVWGQRRVRPPEPCEGRLDHVGCQLGSQPREEWDDLLLRQGDRLAVRCTAARVRKATGDEVSAAPGASPYITLTANGDWVEMDGQRWAWTEVDGVRMTALDWVVPREVMGFGDVKLMAMIGAFLGLDSALFVLMMASVSGSAFGTVLLLGDRSRGDRPVPFGPFLGGATLVWILTGPRLLLWYGRLVTGL